ncbi:S1 family peptidase [Micromonospora chokoriensis]
MRIRGFLGALAVGMAAVLSMGDGAALAISGGQPASVGQFPFMVRLLPVGCGGTLISPQIVLTAGHCVASGEISTAVVGAVDQEDANARVRVSAATWPGGDEWWKHDWGVVKLAQPVQLPSVSLADAVSDEHQMLTTVGWGRSYQSRKQQRFLQWVNLRFMDDAVCTVREGGLGSQYGPKRNLCAYATEKKSFCGGDSGGPALVRRSDGMWRQVGIVSYGGDCDPESPGDHVVYTEVARFESDIRASAAQLMNQSGR